VDVLRELYASASFSEDALANPLSRAETEAGPLGRALLYRTSLVQSVPAARAEAAQRALALARDGGRYASTVRVFLPVLREIAPSQELAWFAPEAARAFLVAGRLEQAGAWLALVRAQAAGDPSAEADWLQLLALARLTGAATDDDWEDGALERWWRGRADADAETATADAELVFSLFDGLGEPLAPGLWAALLADVHRSPVVMPPPAVWVGLEAAADAGRTAETVALALVGLGAGGPAQAAPVVLRRVLRALRAVGLEGAARALAVEAATAAGL
jgi:hypothetical protein